MRREIIVGDSTSRFLSITPFDERFVGTR